MDDDVRRLSAPQRIKNACLNLTIGPWMRCVDLVLREYQPRSTDVDEEAERVVKMALLLMLTRYYDEEDIVMLLDSSSIQLPKRLSETTKFDLARVIDNTPPEGRIDDIHVDDDAPPQDDEGTTKIIRDDDSGEMEIEDD